MRAGLEMVGRDMAWRLAVAQNSLPRPSSHLMCHRTTLHVEAVVTAMHYAVLLLGVYSCH